MLRTCYLSMILFMLTSLGCAMCDSSMDCQYNAYGGVRDRIDRVNGRVASLFDPAASLNAVTAAEPVEDTLPDVEGAEGASPTEEGAGSDLIKDLLEELDKMDALPDVPTDSST